MAPSIGASGPARPPPEASAGARLRPTFGVEAARGGGTLRPKGGVPVSEHAHEEPTTISLVDLWQPVGTPPPAQLGDARAVVHQALHLTSRLAGTRSLLEWLDDHRLLAGELVRGRRGFRAALRIGDLTLLLIDPAGIAIKTLPLESRTYDEALGWLVREAEALGVGTDTGAPDVPRPPLPEALDGKLEVRDRPAFAELDRWYGNGDRALRNVARVSEGASAVRCSARAPSLATDLFLPAREGESPRRVTVGMSPGDETIDEPHLFVRPTPAPGSPYPELVTPARWEHDAAVLRGSAIATEHDADAQATLVQRFLEASIPAAHGALRRTWRRRAEGAGPSHRPESSS